MAAAGVLVHREVTMSTDALPFTEPQMFEQPSYDGPLELRVSWVLTDGAQTLLNTWSIIDTSTGESIQWGSSETAWTRGCEFAEGAMIVHRLRDLRGLSRPF